MTDKAQQLSARSDEMLAELNTLTPIEVRFADGSRWRGTLTKRLDEVLAQHKQECKNGKTSKTSA